jgi:hypothetical protein
MSMHERPQPFRHRVGDLRHQVLGGARQHGIGVADDPLCAKHGGLDLVGRQHQGWQVEPLLQDVAHAGLAADRHALFDQSGDVAIDGAFRGFEFGRDRVRRQRLSRAPEHLDDLEQSVGASHDKSLFSSRPKSLFCKPAFRKSIFHKPTFHKPSRPMLTACWQQGVCISGQHLN